MAFGSILQSAQAGDKDNLSGKYGARGIPCLVILYANSGKLVSKDGRG